MKQLNIFSLAWLQVSLICLNTWQIANKQILGALVVGFLISLVWTFNVKRAAFGTLIDKLVYSFGACAGTATGLIAATLIYS